MTGHWRNGISVGEYRFHVRHLQLPLYQNNRGRVETYDKDAWLRMMQTLKEKKVSPSAEDETGTSTSDRKIP